ncbi:hypothetical protein DTO271G3_6944 [Paecilomyces variotii]|nr:hypothetical protein DTO271G3_6944 [Paecilomyces variotii]
MKSLLILLPLSLFSILHTTNAIPLPDGLRHDTLTLKHDQSHAKEEGHHFTFFAKEEYAGKHPPTTTPTTIISTARNPDANARLTDLEEPETKPQTSSSPESLNTHHIITPSNNEPKQSAQDTRPLQPGVLRTVSSRLLHGFSIPSFSSSSKNNSAKENIPTTSHNAASGTTPIHYFNSKASLEPWMIVLGMIWLVPITVVLVEMLEYAWMWCRGDTDILASIESGRKSRFWMSANKMAGGEKDIKMEGGYVIQPYYDDDDSSDDGFDDLVP